MRPKAKALGYLEAAAEARTGDSRFLAALGMTISFRNCQRKAKTQAMKSRFPEGMTERKARATTGANTGILRCALG
jgi:hypothetical protein